MTKDRSGANSSVHSSANIKDSKSRAVNPRTQSIERRILFALSLLTLLMLLPYVLLAWHYKLDLLTSFTLFLALALICSYLVNKIYRLITDVLDRVGLQLDALGNDEYNSWHLAAYNKGRVGSLRHDFNKLSVKLAQKQHDYIYNETFIFDFIAQLDMPILILDHHDKVYLASKAFEAQVKRTSDDLLGASSSELGLIRGTSKQDAANQNAVKQDWQIDDESPFSHRFNINHRVLKHAHRDFDLLLFTSIEAALRENEKRVWYRLIRVINHEVRNSLTPIYSIAQSLREMKQGKTDSSNQVTDGSQVNEIDMIKVIENRAEQLLTFVESYSAFSKLAPANKRACSSLDINAEVLALFPDVCIEEASTPVHLFVDSGQLHQALINVLKNAFEANQLNESGQICKVSLRWTQSSHHSYIQVIDCGQGIAKQSSLFVPFFTTKSNGTGVGLVLARELIRNQGGNLRLENRGDQQGAIATIELPKFEN